VRSKGTVISEGDQTMGEDGEMEEVVEAGEVEMPSSPPRRLLPASVFQRIAEWELERSSEQESDMVAAVEAGEALQKREGENLLHPFSVMRIASLVILASKEYAGRGVEELKAVLDLWTDLVSLALLLNTHCSSSDSGY